MRFLLLVLLAFVLLSGFDRPEVDARAGILVEAESGRVLWEKNAREPLAMASTTKIMTAVLTLELGNLEDIVTVSGRAAAAPKVKMYLQKGEQISLGGLLHALMLQSSNDAAVAIAEHIGGTVEDFCAAMTAKAREIGALDTIFETPSGLDGKNHSSTAFDMALITLYALKNPHFVEIINTGSASVTSSRTTYSITNKNRLLNEYTGANGVKTGFTNKAGHCFVGAALREDMQLVSVVFASGWGNKGREQKWVDTKRILNHGFDNFELEQIVNCGDEAGQLGVTRSKTAEIPLYYDSSVTLPVSAVDQIDLAAYFPAELQAPIEEGQAVGEGRIYINGEFFTAVPIVTAQGAARHDFKTSLEKVIREFLRLGTSQEVEITLPEF